jgi:hypothetical protein
MVKMCLRKDFRLDIRLGPHGLQQLLLGDQSAGVRHQIGQYGKRLGRQEHALVVGRLPVAPETLVDGIEPKGWELLHECLLQGRNGVLRG